MKFPRHLAAPATCALLSLSTQVHAIPFNSIDPRSFAMGGTGVASGTSANAGFMNPALLGAANDGDRFSLEFPIVGARVVSENNVIDELNNLQDSNVQNNLESAINTFDAAPSTTTAAAVGSAATALQVQLDKLSGNALQGELLGGAIVGIPGHSFGASLNISVRAVVGGRLNITAQDDQFLTDIATAAASPAALATDPTVVNVLGGQNLDQILTSNFEARGAAIGEVGVSMAREVSIFNEKISFGITPKVVRVRTFDYVADVNTASISAKDGEKDYSDFNLDIGVAKQFEKTWKVGLTVKDLVSHDYKTVLGNTIKIEPQARAGVAYDNGWLAVALDADLTENSPVGLESSKTQNVAIGAEIDVWDTLQLRVGYHDNLSTSSGSGTPTVGLGLSPFGVHIDVAAEYSDNNGDKQFGAAAQLGFRF